MIRDLANSGAMPTLEAMVRFTAQRQKLIAHNIANLDTPDFVQADVSTTDFQAALRKAVENRRDRSGGLGTLPTFTTREVHISRDGSLTLRPSTPSGGTLLHDRNNRDMERLMQDLGENQLAFRLATDLLRREQDVLRVAISQRV
jgi:flagellar basal-body rod protein FlgB